MFVLKFSFGADSISVDGGVDLQTLPRMRMCVNGQEKHAQVRMFTGKEIYQCRWRRFISVDGGLDLQTLPRMRLHVNGQEKHLQVRRFISVDGGDLSV